MFSELEREIKKHFSDDEAALIIKAYKYADKAHSGQKRKSGEPYIIHPIHVAYLLMTKFHLYDAHAVAAALLHDTIEDTSTTYEELIKLFNEDVANLVLSVTDSKHVEFKNKTAEERFNNAAILRNMLKDFRTIYIKSADRFHNMSTLEYQDETRRLNKAHQTLAFYVPLNYGIGASEAARELDDLCLKFILPEEYYKTLALKQECEMKYQRDFERMIVNLTNIFIRNGIKASINMRMKNISSIYNSLAKMAIEDIPDLINIDIIASDKANCYKALTALREHYNISSLKNYLTSPNFNGYRALDLMISNFENHPVKISICTALMAEANLFGYATISNHLKDKENDKVQKIVSNGSDFLVSLRAIGEYHKNNSRLLKQVESELFNPTIMVHTASGLITLRENATVADLINTTSYNLSDITHIYVNGEPALLSTVLKDQDKVLITKSHSTLKGGSSKPSRIRIIKDNQN